MSTKQRPETSTSTPTYKLICSLEDEYKVRIENPKDFYSSFFKDIYVRASNAVGDIVKQSKAITENTKLNNDDESYSRMNRESEYLYSISREREDFNNIVAFIGERGTGKSSAMFSFLNYLLLEWSSDKKQLLKGFDHRLINYNFLSLPKIDPSLFEKDQNIIEVVLAHMFSRFDEHLKNEHPSIKMENKRKLLEKFEEVYEILQTVKGGSNRYNGEAIETLKKLADSTVLKKKINELIKVFIVFFSDKGENSYLVIPIDDFDLNVSAAAEMSEQIRKYFMIPNVVILMSVNISQLKEAKELSIRKEYDGKSDFVNDDPSNFAIQYLLKFIPDNRRFNLPDLKVNVKETSIVHLNNKRDKAIIEKYIFNSLYRKTGLIFISNSDKLHILTPANLRRLMELIRFVDYKLIGGFLGYDKVDRKLEGVSKKENLRMFEDYMINTYLPSIISKRYIKDFKKIVGTERSRLNYTTLHVFYGFEEKYNADLSDKKSFRAKSGNSSADELSNDESMDKEMRLLLNPFNNPNNISLGDVLFMIRRVDAVINSPEFTMFADGIKLFYSIQILKAKNSGVVENVMDLCGESIVPSQDLLRLVSLKEIYDLNPNPNPDPDHDPNPKKGYISVVNHTIDIDYFKSDISKFENAFRLFICYAGKHYRTRRSSPKIHFDRYEFKTNKNFTIDIFSCLVNSYYLRSADSSKDYCVEVIPLHSIDLIEIVMFKYFRISKDVKTLTDSIYSIYKEIICRIEKSTNGYAFNYDEMVKPFLKNKYIYIDDKIKNEIIEMFDLLHSKYQNDCKY